MYIHSPMPATSLPALHAPGQRVVGVRPVERMSRLLDQVEQPATQERVLQGEIIEANRAEEVVDPRPAAEYFAYSAQQALSDVQRRPPHGDTVQRQAIEAYTVTSATYHPSPQRRSSFEAFA